LIKPATDAHTLTTPAPLIDLASQQLQHVRGMRNSKIVILLASEFMYFQRPHTDIKDQAQIVRTFVPNASFPPKLGFIEVPYSQGPSFFMNVAIYHEIGHFVYEELSNSGPPHPDFVTLQSATDRSIRREFKGISKNRQAFAMVKKIVEFWTQELFCDLFAIRLVGPAFSFAFIEMLGMLGLLAEQVSVRFNPTHPAPAFRFAEHMKMLRDDSWWKAIENIDADQKNILEKLANISRAKYKFYLDDKRPGTEKVVNIFLDVVVPRIRKLIRDITPRSSTLVSSFNKERRSIEDCLRVGVVPHSRDSTALDPISIINSAFCFYLTSLPDVVSRFEPREKHSDVAIHSLWTKRFEMWTMKAIEDSQNRDRFRKSESLWSSLGKKF